MIISYPRMIGFRIEHCDQIAIKKILYAPTDYNLRTFCTIDSDLREYKIKRLVEDVRSLITSSTNLLLSYSLLFYFYAVLVISLS